MLKQQHYLTAIDAIVGKATFNGVALLSTGDLKEYWCN